MFPRYAKAAPASYFGSHFSMASVGNLLAPALDGLNREGVDHAEDIRCDILGDL